MINKRKLIVSTVVASMLLSFAACGSAKLDVPAEDSEPITTVAVEDEQAPKAATAEKTELPAYEYPGPEEFYSVLYRYIIDELGKNYEKADVSIPCPIILKEDESNDDDIRVYGNFEIYNYELKGDTLEMVSGGSYPGCIHLKKTDAGYEVTGMDEVLDGSDHIPTAKKIFGDLYDKYMETMEDNEYRENIRAQVIANYVAANNLPIKAYQDYGWDPVTLPKENIDSFYSTLD